MPEAIATLLEAGLNVWMITGDKAETAIAISHQCHLITPQHRVEKVLHLQGEALRQRILDLHGFVEGRASMADAPSGAAFSLSVLMPDVEDDLQFPRQRSVDRAGGTPPSSGRPSLLMRLSQQLSLVGDGPAAGRNGNKVAVNSNGQFKSTAAAKTALIIDGFSLEALWSVPELKEMFTEAVRSIPTVIACRVSPKQKAALVRMVKTGVWCGTSQPI